VLEVITGAAGLFDAVGVVVSRRCAAKAAKHEDVRVLATSKLNTVHSHISKALEDCIISDDEYKLMLEEIEKYRTMKEELRHKHTPGSVIGDETKNELTKRGREQARASFIKKPTASESPSPWAVFAGVRVLPVIKLQILLNYLHLRRMYKHIVFFYSTLHNILLRLF